MVYQHCMDSNSTLLPRFVKRQLFKGWESYERDGNGSDEGKVMPCFSPGLNRECGRR